MTLTIDLPPEQAILLRQEAAACGMDESEYVRRMLAERLANGKPKINFFNPNATPEELARNRAVLKELLRQWREEDATDDPDEIRGAEEELAAFKKALNENRAGERPLFQ